MPGPELCACPNTDPLGAITQPACEFTLEQIQFAGIQKILDNNPGSGARNKIADVATAQNLATWTGLRDAADDTKVIFTPDILDAKIVPGSEIEIGGSDNTTIEGTSRIMGHDQSVLTGYIENCPQETIEEIRSAACHRIGLFLFNRFGDIGYIELTGVEVHPVELPAKSMAIGDAGTEGRNTVTKNMIKINLPEGWSKKLKAIKGSSLSWVPSIDLRQ